MAHPDKIAYRFLRDGEKDEVEISYAELYTRAKRIASELQPKSHSDQPIALLLYPAGIDFIIAFFGCLYAGVIAVPLPLPTKRSIQRVTRILEDTQAQFILTTSESYASLSKSPLFATFQSVTWLKTDEPCFMLPSSGKFTTNSNSPIAFLQYTSGSTSAPKGVMVTHKNIIANQQMIQEAFGHNSETIFAGWLPHFHDMGLIGNILQPMYLGIPAVLMAPVAFLQKPLRWLEAISYYRATTSGGPNFAYELCFEKITNEEKKRLDLSSWQVAFNGAEPVRAKTLERFSRSFESCGFNSKAFYPCYGLAEATLFVSGNIPQTSPIVLSRSASTFVSVGKPWGEERIVIVNPKDFSICQPNEEGEIWVHGPHIAEGYWNQKEATEETFKAKLKADERTFLRTGDLGFQDDNGNLFITGRLKDLMIIRGKNIYPQDVENLVGECHAAVRPHGCAAFSMTLEGEEKLVIVAEIQREQIRNLQPVELFAKIRQVISQEHQISTFAIVLINPNTLPKTSSGKVQRSLCKTLFLEDKLEKIAQAGSLSAPETNSSTQDVEKEIKGKLAEILEVASDQIAANQPLTSYGVDSLGAITLQSFIESRWNISLPFEEFLEGLSILDIVHEVQKGALKKISPQLIPEPSAQEYSLSFQQQGIWMELQSSEQFLGYNLGKIIEVLSPLDTNALKKSLTVLMERHPLLRTVFQESNAGPIQKVISTADLPLYEKRLLEKDLKPFLDQEVIQPFSTAAFPLFRLWVIKTETERSFLFIVAHHLIADLWSLGLFLQELFHVYDSLPLNLPTPPYVDYVNWQQQYFEKNKIESSLEFWKKQLPEEYGPINLPFDRPRPLTRNVKGDSFHFELSPALGKKLKAFAQTEQTTPFAVLMTTYFLLLAQYVGEKRVCIGTTSHGRNHPRWHSCLGLFANLVPIFLSVSFRSSFKDMVAYVKKTCFEALSQHQLPFYRLLEEIKLPRSASHTPLFQTMFVYQHVLSIDKELNALIIPSPTTCSPVKKGSLLLSPVLWQPALSLFELSLYMNESPHSFCGYFEYNVDVFDRETIELMRNSYEQLLHACLTDPEKHYGNLPEYAQSTKEPLRITQTAESLVDLFIAAVKKAPSHCVLSSDKGQLTYESLDAISNQFARLLIQKGVASHSVVAIMMPHSIELIIALLAILKTGAAFLPIDPKNPLSRTLTILDEAKPALLLSCGKLSAQDAKVAQLDLSSLEFAREVEQFDSSELPLQSYSDSLAYIMYTSGSTGKPKGVAISHASLLCYLYAIQKDYQMGMKLHFPFYSSLAFDLTLTSIFLPLLFGHTIHIYEQKEDVASVLNEILRHPQMTHLKLTPSHLHLLKEEKYVLRNALQLIVGGEQLPVSLAEEIYHHFKGRVTIINEYGPTEAAIGCIYFIYPTHLTLTHPILPIGKPISQTRASICNEVFQTLPLNASGELFLGGPNLAYGYWNRPELTAERFIPDPQMTGERMYRSGDGARELKNGQLLCLGRLDRQIKIRGFRIEIEEIESTIRKHPKIKDCIVVVRYRKENDPYLCAYFSSQSLKLDENEVRKFISEKLPHYMVPSTFLFCESIPLTANGKVDLKALPIPEEAANSGNPPLTPLQKQLAGIWAEVLSCRLDDIGISSHFFELGGDSIKAMQIVSRSRKMGLNFSISELFSYPTVETLAVHLHCTERISHLGSTEDAIIAKKQYPLSPIQHWFFKHFVSSRHHFNQAVLLDRPRGFNQKILKEAFSSITDHHDLLRALFSTETRSYFIKETGSEVFSIQNYDYRKMKDADLLIAQEITTLQSSLNIEKGPLLRLGLFQTAEGDKLAIVVHHLIFDGVSWKIILEDLDTTYKALEEGKKSDLPSKTLSYPSWVSALLNHYDEKLLAAEIPYWEKLEQETPTVSYKNIADQTTLNFSLSSEESHALIHDLYAATYFQTNEVLLAALSKTFKDLVGDKKIVIHLEGHGRESFSDKVDVTRTVGWFTSLIPVVLYPCPSNDEEEYVKDIQSQISHIPNGGKGYQILTSQPHLKSLFPNDSLQPSIVLNYLGQFSSREYSSFRFQPLLDNLISARASTPYDLQIISFVLDNVFQCYCVFDQKSYSASQREKFIKLYQDHLVNIIKQCQKKKISEQYFIDKTLPLTPLQEGLLFHAIHSKGSSAYFEQVHLVLKGDVNPVFIQRSFQQLVADNETLRSSFRYDGLTSPAQIIFREKPLAFTYTDISSSPFEEQSKLVQKCLEEDQATSFDVENGALMRIQLIKGRDATFHIIWSFHHLILDGWSLTLLFRSLLDTLQCLYKAIPLINYKSPPLEYYSQWLRKADREKAMIYWKSIVADYASPDTLPKQKEFAPINKRSSKQLIHRLPKNLIKNLEKMGRDHCTTLSTLFHAAWGVLLMNYLQRNDVLFGTVFSGRPSELVQSESMVGLFIVTLPVRINANRDHSFAEIASALQNQMLSHETHAFLPIHDIQTLSPLKQRMLDHLFVFENYPFSGKAHSLIKEKKLPFELVSAHMHEETHYPLTVSVIPKETDIDIEIQYDDSIYSSFFIQTLLKHFQNVLELASSYPHLPLQTLKEKNSEEELKFFKHINDTYASYPDQKMLHQLFEEQVQKNPGKIALTMGDVQLSYSELNHHANCLSAYIKKLGALPEMCVGIYLERSIEMIVSWLAVLKAGAVYVPFDPNSTNDRLSTVCEETDINIMLTHSSISSRLASLSVKAVEIDKEWQQILCLDTGTTPNPEAGNPDQLAYMLYTSGSTGKPKGIAMTHRAVCNHFAWVTNHFKLSSEDRMLQLTAFSFDVSLCEFYVLFAGGTLVLAPPAANQQVNLFLQTVQNHKITFLQLVPSFLEVLLEPEILGKLTSLRQVLCGADVLKNEHISKWFKSSVVPLTNLYGLTETCIDATYYQCSGKESERDVPVGKPIANFDVYILNDHYQLLPFGTKGELFIGGLGLARGYYKRPDLTAEKFIPHPFSKGKRIYRTQDLVSINANGDLVFSGRKDNQIKLRGYRIELGEIEMALSHYPGVEQVLVRPLGEDANRFLCAYLIGTEEFHSDSIKQFLSQHLPYYMIPSRFIQLAHFPLTAHGKIDVASLPIPKEEIVISGSTINDDVQKWLINVWHDILKIPHSEISVEHNFFDLGGNSIKLMQLHHRLNQEFQQNITMDTLFQYHTIKALSSFLRSKDESKFDLKGMSDRLTKGRKHRQNKR